MTVRLNNLILAFMCIAGGGCASVSSPPKQIEKFEQIDIGNTADRVVQVFGPPSYSYEKYPAKEYKTMNYDNGEKQPLVFFTLDRDARVIGKSKWVYQNDQLKKLEYTLNERFKNVAFKKYVPCQTRSDRDEILISEKDGLYIAAEKDNVILISWATPELTQLRAEHIVRTCPRLQK